MDDQELAVIQDVGIGMRDCRAPCLFFTVKMLHCVSLQILNWESAAELIKTSKVYDVKELNGKMCVVSSKDRLVTFLRLLE